MSLSHAWAFVGLSAILVAIASTAGAQQSAGPAGVTIYRCADSRGQLVALRDSPCRPGEQQETVTMQRPRDPPPRTASTAAPVAPVAPLAAASPQEIRIVTVQPPQPMFECTSPDGQIYASDSGEGTQRWVPLWALGVPAWHPRPGPPPRPPVAPPRPESGPGVTLPWPPRPGPRPPGGVVVPAGGTWVRDPCVRIPQEEVCRRLSDRRFEILRIYHAAMPSGRAELDREQRVIDARMANDCRGI
jgi:hypothetical protein